MKFSLITVTGALVAASMLLCAPASAGSHWKFTVVNKSNTPAIEFRTQEDGEWSSNWIKDRVEPGDTFDMDFGTDKGDCEVQTEIRFTDGTSFQHTGRLLQGQHALPLRRQDDVGMRS